MNQLTVFFDDPFWVGVFELAENATLRTCRFVFGAEPKDAEVFDLVAHRFSRLDFSRPFSAEPSAERKISPKRLQRLIGGQLQQNGVGTKAQQALQAERELRKTERRTASKEEREREKQARFEQHREKKKEKHKGH